ncbi:MAG: DUF2889 domain-containing protein [Actinomycetota bacterium]|nr:DUF2889 domain-containing protein [Actinomycetota bacterium]
MSATHETRPGGVHPRHGPHRPHAGTPSRRPRSLRRTTTHTSLRPDGPLGDVHLSAVGRDLWTGADGRAQVRARAGVDAVISFISDRSLRSLAVEPPAGPDDRLDLLEGRRVSSGFRRTLDEALPAETRAESLRYQLLDDLPTAVLVSGYAMGAAGMHPPRRAFDVRAQADICSGWATGATILVEAEQLGRVPHGTGPVAPLLVSDADPDAWHSFGPMGPHSMRRWRRIDVWRPVGDGPFAVEAFFRDSHMDAAGAETIVHEYLVRAALRPGTLEFADIEVDIGVLPWVECPAAGASATRLIGTTPHDLRERIRHEFTGTSTCTHLNDTLRALAALPYMVRAVGG